MVGLTPGHTGGRLAGARLCSSGRWADCWKRGRYGSEAPHTQGRSGKENQGLIRRHDKQHMNLVLSLMLRWVFHIPLYS